MVRVAAQRRARRVPRSGTPWVPRRSALGGAVLRRRQAVSNHPCTNRVFLLTFFHLAAGLLSYLICSDLIYYL